ncbi:hypothetical protein [Paraburkholderia fungorum]|uniref:hypothetical protein n=1 Tax=Paraburkholderia fungorum TaxID=134537 RepID=UPI002097C3FD|nr:hypothetical protein [Paraburkholderia fungorum]USX10998.1 hypothetical protein NHH62_37370 [Paraburkholderia fungorum]
MPAIPPTEDGGAECSASPTSSAIGLVSLAALSARAEHVVALNESVAAGLTGSNTAASASPAYAGTSVAGDSRVSASSAVSNYSVAATTSDGTAMIAVDLRVSAGSTGPLLWFLLSHFRIR